MMNNVYSEFHASDQLIPVFKKGIFESANGWDLGWLLLEPLNIAESDEHEILLSKRLSPGQKALYFFWYLDAQVINGGFIQFYCNGYRKYLPAIIAGLELLGDYAMLDLITKAESLFLENEEFFIKQMKLNDWRPLYKDIKEFEELDTLYYNLRDTTMDKIERYVRTRPNEFGQFEN